MGAPEYLSVEESGGVEVGAVEGAARNLVGPVGTHRTRPHDVVGLARQHYVGLVIYRSHVFASCIRPAASCTALIILS